MAKQTFTTGSVLTSAQMNNLQANDYNWTVNQKTASYVLAASDVGTRIEMNSGSATTVTVNTGVFAAGDTLFIQNIGTGSCVVTAGTATVQRASNASLTLTQYQGGYLYFISTSNAVFFADAGFTSPLTTKGDLFTWDTGNARLAVGTNGQYLSADSTTATGLKWASVASTKNFSLLNAGGTALSGAASQTISSIGGYDQYYILVSGASTNTAYDGAYIRFNSDTGSNYYRYGGVISNPGTYASSFMNNYAQNTTAFGMGEMGDLAASTISGGMFVNGGNTTGKKMVINIGFPSNTSGSASGSARLYMGYYDSTSVISSITIASLGGNFDAGTIFIYGAA